MKIVRFDRNVMDNLSWLQDTYQQDHSLVLHTLIFLAYDVQYNVCTENLFGAKIWDPYQAAKTLGFSHKTFINKTKEEERRELAHLPKDQWEAYIKSRKENKKPLWDTAFCNAIYILMEQSKLEKFQVESPNSSGSGLRHLTIFDSAIKFYHKKTKKIYYEVEYSQSYLKNLASYFTRFDLDLLIKLPPACRILYLGLMNLRDLVGFSTNSQNIVEMRPSIDKLFKWANAKQKKQPENVRELKKKLDLINQVARIVLKRGDDGPVYIDYSLQDYQPKITIQFTNEEIDQRQKETVERFEQFLLINLKSKFRKVRSKEMHTYRSSTSFFSDLNSWLGNLDADLEPKMKALEDTYVMVFGNTKHFENNKWMQYKEVIPGMRLRITHEQFQLTDKGIY